MSQDRLVATCEENDLNYVLDPTNFQPEITLRNAVRHMLSKGPGTENDLGVFISPVLHPSALPDYSRQDMYPLILP
jgi:tRNA(Ile)-lysidine synthase TilS/MesJ